MGDFDATALNGLSQEAICAKLGLGPQDDGTFQHQDANRRLVLLPLGEILPWQKADTGLTFRFLAGDALALSWSGDGHNAEAAHLGASLPHHRLSQNIAAHVWLTAESLGTWSLMALDGAHSATRFEAAAPDWYPTPIAATQGEA